MRIVLIDGMGLVYRAYFAFGDKPLRNSAGLNTAAPFGFLATLIDLIEELKPTHWGLAWDSAEPSFRHESMAGYKAHRSAPPEEMIAGLPYIRQLADGLRLHQAEVPGYEADDLLAQWALSAAQMSETEIVWIVSADKDLAQLVSEKIHLYRPARGKAPAQKLDPSGVKQHFGVAPHQIPDYLALVGDESDNLPGVRGIGPKTAAQLLSEYGSLEKLYQSLPILPKSVAQKLEAGREGAWATYALARLEFRSQEAIPENAKFIPSLFVLRSPEWSVLLPLLDELEFRKHKERLLRFWHTEQPADSPSPPMGKLSYRMLHTPADLSEYLNALPPHAPIAFDTETTDLHPMYAELVGISLCAQPEEAVFIPIQQKDWPAWRAAFEPFLQSSRLKIAHNLKYDWVVLAQHGLKVQGPLFDTLLADYLLDPERPHSLEEVARRELNLQKAHSYNDLFIGLKTKDIRQVPIERLAAYACQDADLALRLYKILDEKLRAKSLSKLYEEVEGPLLSLLAEMELRGVRIDVEYLHQLNAEYEKELTALEAEAHRLAGETFNLNSTKQLSELLFGKLGLPVQRKTPKGQPATDEEALQALVHRHPLIEVLLRYRELYKLRYTYGEGLLRSIHPKTGRVHTTFQQAVAATGRLSSQNPNLQNIPIRTEAGKRFRKAFVAGAPGWVLLSADYSQIELRIAAALSGDPQMIADFQTGRDIHTATAQRLFGVEEVTADMRRTAKMVNFGIIYGITAHGLVQRLGGTISRTEAQHLIQQYFRRYPGVHAYIQTQIKRVEQLGYAETLLGRRRYIPHIHSQNKAQKAEAERLAINTPIQGTAADMIKLAMIKLWKRLPEVPMLLQIHDELLWEVPAERVEDIAPIIQTEMAQALPLPNGVPVEVEIKVGQNWLDMSPAYQKAPK
ncbi:MAG: DNA polymerase I [Bacteroidia bacterium]|nr:DNA polymerase I [Bacteroidia bacterium]MCX7652601.1 DNA polymerase I [Bacteroidia bacterium]MDW8417723.1 DNA polymerase I [Bacteroidia bacterium]